MLAVGQTIFFSELLFNYNKQRVFNFFFKHILFKAI